MSEVELGIGLRGFVWVKVTVRCFVVLGLQFGLGLGLGVFS